MAIDLNQPIGKAKKVSESLPTKRHINLAAQASSPGGIKRVTILWGVLILVIVLAVAKFGVYDPLSQIGAAEREAQAQKLVQSSLDEKLKDYDTVETEYQSYVSTDLTSSLDTLAVLDMVERTVMPTAKVAQVSIQNNVLTLVLADADMDTAGRLTDTLNAQDSVASVSVSRSSTEDDVASKGAASDVITRLIVTFKDFEPVTSSSSSSKSSSSSSGSSGQASTIAGGSAVVTSGSSK